MAKTKVVPKPVPVNKKIGTVIAEVLKLVCDVDKSDIFIGLNFEVEVRLDADDSKNSIAQVKIRTDVDSLHKGELDLISGIGAKHDVAINVGSTTVEGSRSLVITFTAYDA